MALTYQLGVQQDANTRIQSAQTRAPYFSDKFCFKKRKPKQQETKHHFSISNSNSSRCSYYQNLHAKREKSLKSAIASQPPEDKIQETN